MTLRDDRREAAIERMADHVLAEGLGAATLRPLALAAGTSDRMLLYYFADKDEVLTVTLDRIATRMIAQLDRAIPAEPRRSFAVLLQQAWAELASDSLRAFMPLWLELASGAARGLQPHRDVAGKIMDGFLAWTTIRLQPEGDGDPARLAPLFLASIEGMYLLTAVGRGDLAEATAQELVSRSQ
ncbi:MAG: TetR/AcrR family transcriptional regulator [Caulobacteraceae bacterium]|nr:TetR/AcrR family transcriptional regulator [Caulobacteraceae bacterium]